MEAMKTRRDCYENIFQRKVSLRMEDSSNSDAARHFGVPETCVRD